MKIIDNERASTTSQQEKSSEDSCNKALNGVAAISTKSPNPTTMESVKNLFLNGLLLKQLSLHLAVNI